MMIIMFLLAWVVFFSSFEEKKLKIGCLEFLSFIMFRTHELLSKKEVVIDYFDGFFNIQRILRPMALSRTAEIKVWASTLASKNIWKKTKI